MFYIIILTINVLFLFFVKSDNRYWLLSIPLWIILFSGFSIWRMNSDRNYKTLEAQYWKTAENRSYGDFSKLNELREAGKKAQVVNNIFLNSIALQTLITFILQMVGNYRTKLRLYVWTKWIFGVLFVLTFLIAVLSGIVPTGPMV